MTSEFRKVAMFVTADLQKLRICGVRTFMIYTRTKFQMTTYSGSFDRGTKKKAKHCHMSFVRILSTTIILPRYKLHMLLRITTVHNF